MFCGKCGASLKDNDKFCGRCGSAVNVSKPAMNNQEVDAQPGQTPSPAMQACIASGVQEDPISGQPVAVQQTTQQLAAVQQTAQQSHFAGNPPVSQADAGSENVVEKPKGKAKIILIIVIAAVIALSGIAVGVWYYLHEQADQALHQTHPIYVSIDAEGYSDKDTLIPLQISGTNLDGEEVSEVQFVDRIGTGIELMKGTYTLTIPASPLTSDGLLYKVPETSFCISLPNDLEPGSPYDATEHITATLSKASALDETDAMIQVAYDYALMDESQRAKADELHAVAVKAHADAVAAEQARIAAEEEARRAAEEAARIAAEKHLALIDPKSDLASYSWDELAKIAEEISYSDDSSAALDVAKKYNLVGSDGMLNGSQSKSVPLSGGGNAKVQLAGIYHDEKADGSGKKAGLTFIFDCSIAKESYNTHNIPGGKGLTTNVGGWRDSDLRKWLANEGMSMLPSDLSNVIRAVNKKSNNSEPSNSTSTVTTTQDKLWEPSMVEVYGHIDWPFTSFKNYSSVLNAEGSQYKLFRDQGINCDVDVAQKAPLKRPYNGNDVDWWTRSIAPMGGNTIYPIYPDSSSLNSGETSGCDNGIVPGFCL